MTLTKVTYSMIEGAPVNVLDYGVDPTGVADSSAALQSAIDTGLPVYVPPGTYKLMTTIANADNLILYGEGPVPIAGNDPQTNKSGVNFVWGGSAAGPVFDIYPDVATSLKISEIKIYVDKTFTGKVININGSLVTNEQARAILEVDGLGIYRTPLDYTATYAPGDSTSIGVYVDLTQTTAGESHACVGYKFNRMYLFNLNVGFKIEVADAVAGQTNFFNSNYFNDIYMYQVYRALDCIGGAGTGRGEIVSNTFTSFQVQPGLDSSSVAADGCIRIAYNTHDNVFSGLKIWDIPDNKKLASSNLASDTNGFFINRVYGTFTGEPTNGFHIEDGLRNINMIPQYESWVVSGVSVFRLSSDGALFGGATATKNALNYFETDTFTPELTINDLTTGITYTNQLGEYTRINNMVSFVIELTLSSKGSVSGVVRIKNLPFLSGAMIGTVNFGYFANFSLGGTYPLSGQVASANTVIQLYKQTNGVSVTELVDTDITNTSILRLSGTYYV